MRRLLTALPALALLSGCGLLYAELEIPSTTVILERQSFPATPVGSPLVKDIPFDIGQSLTILTEPDVSFELRLTRMLVVIASGSVMGDFGDIQSVTLSVLPPAGQTLPEEAILASYTKAPPPANQNPTSIAVAGMSNLDLGPYITGGAMTLRLKAESVTGSIPAWTADVGGEFYLKVRVDYGNMVSNPPK
jgi:hypothetical protein